MSKRNLKLRITYIIPIIFLYLLCIGYGSFILFNLDGLKEINRLGSSIIMLLLVLITSLFGTYRIWSWIKSGKL